MSRDTEPAPPPNLRAMILSELEEARALMDATAEAGRHFNDLTSYRFGQMVLACRRLADAVSMLLDERLPP